MICSAIPFKDTTYFSDFICDYLSKNKKISPFYDKFPSLDSFKYQINEKSATFPKKNREILVNSLKNQYENFQISEKTKENIDLLRKNTTFTITTGHQLCLFTGPLYFIHKIASTIKTCILLKNKYPENDFVPVYWLASEDHDFLEVNHFSVHSKKLFWHSNQSGMVGNFNTNELKSLSEMLKNELGMGKNAEELNLLFKNSYLKNKDLASATRFLVNELFQKYGLVIIDGNSADLKQLFIPFFKKDIFENTNYQKVTETIEEIKKVDNTYPTQVNPREINCFYLQEDSRERILTENHKFIIKNTSLSFSKEELKNELENTPEKFSPNVILRPLYQEVILPNLCYIGGGGEIAYWLELKAMFKENDIPFPILLLRNSVLLIDEKQEKKLRKYNLLNENIFLKKDNLTKKIIEENTEILIDFSQQRNFLTSQFDALYEIANQTDPSFRSAVEAQKVKQIKGLNHLEKRLLKAQKKKHSELIDRILSLKNELFPNEALQERTENFSTFYLKNRNLIEILIENFDPFDFRFLIIKL